MNRGHTAEPGFGPGSLVLVVLHILELSTTLALQNPAGMKMEVAEIRLRNCGRVRGDLQQM